MKKKILEIKNLEALIGTKKIINDLNLNICENEIHLIMGPNGSGKSTLSKILAGHPSYSILNGTIKYCNENLLEKEIDIRSQEGLFLAFQYPLEINGVTNYDFLRSIYNFRHGGRPVYFYLMLNISNSIHAIFRNGGTVLF